MQGKNGVIREEIVWAIFRYCDKRYYRTDEAGWCCWCENPALAKHYTFEEAATVLKDIVYNCKLQPLNVQVLQRA